MNATIWDKRYSTEDYIYGKKPNDFLVEHAGKIRPGSILCLAEGEGRNAVYLSSLGYDVLAVDSSSAGLKKATNLALERNVPIRTEHTDLENFTIEPNSWEGIISIFCHLPEHIRSPLHKKVVNGLKKNGVFILEAYTPLQLKYNTGGPKDINLLYNLEMLKTELDGLIFNHALETVREVYEGLLHVGTGSVVQIVAVKP